MNKEPKPITKQTILQIVIGSIIAVLLINSGLKVLDMNKTLPKCFKGTPALFIYTALLSMAFTGISGTSVLI